MNKRLLSLVLAIMLITACVPSITASEGETPGQQEILPTVTPASVDPTPSTSPEETEVPPTPSTPQPTTQPTTQPTATPDESAPGGTPAATPENPATDTNTPTPTPAPNVQFSGSTAIAVIMADGQFTLSNGVSAKDETGKKLEIKVKDYGSFNIRKPGDYTVVLSVLHPVTKAEYTFTQLIHVYKTAAQAAYSVTFSGGDMNVKLADALLDVYSGISASDQDGMPLAVEIIDDGGLSINRAGSYTAVYAALQPVTGEQFEFSRKINVLTDEEYAEYLKTINPLYGKSNDRYRKYMAYREEVYTELSSMTDLVQSELEEKVALIASVFPQGTAVRYARAVPVIVDDAPADPDEIASAVVTLTDIHGEYTLEPIDSLMPDNWSDVLAVFVATSTLDVDDPLDLYNLRQIKFDMLGDVFRDMIDITYIYDGEELTIVLHELTADDMTEVYSLDEKRSAALSELMQPEFQSVFASLTGDLSFVDLTEDEIASIRSLLPQDLMVAREAVVVTAHTLVGKVKYFWAGKYPHIGWNSSWGMPRLVTSMGSKTTGLIRPNGLDCSGFVTWTFINAARDESVINTIGNGSSNQWSKSTSLGWDEAQPGDLAFRAKPNSVRINHVGIVVSVDDDGTYMIAHCSSAKGGVVVTEAWSSGFRYMRRPILYAEDN